MKVSLRHGFLASAAFVCLAHVAQASAQQTATPAVAKLVAEPARIVLKAGESMPFKVTAYDAQGNPVPGAAESIRLGGPRRALSFSDGMVVGREAGTFTATATYSPFGAANPVTLEIPVTITWPPITKLQIVPEPGRLYTGITLAHNVAASHADGSPRKGVAATWRSSDPTVAAVDRFGFVTALKAGAVTITATVDDVKAAKAYTVTANPAATLTRSTNGTIDSSVCCATGAR